jgi:hypothetical protein
LDAFKANLIWTNANTILPPEVWLDASLTITWIAERDISREIMHPLPTYDAKSSTFIASFAKSDKPSYFQPPKPWPAAQVPGQVTAVPNTGDRLATGPSLFTRGTPTSGIFAGIPSNFRDNQPTATRPTFHRGQVITFTRINFIPDEQLALSSPTDWMNILQIRVDGRSQYILRDQIPLPLSSVARIVMESDAYQINCLLSEKSAPPNNLRLFALHDIFRYQELYIWSGWYDQDPSLLTTSERIAIFNAYGDEIISVKIPFLRMHAWRLAGSIRRLLVRLSIDQFEDATIAPPTEVLLSYATYSTWLNDLVIVILPAAKRARGAADPTV